ncbi:MAG: sulfatase-like hydrolase/transferase [Monoglobales bacterium]
MKTKKTTLSVAALSFIIFIALLFLYRPNYQINIDTSLKEGILCDIGYTAKLGNLPQLSDYDIMKEAAITNEDGKINLSKIPPTLDEIWIVSSTGEKYIIEGIEIKQFGLTLSQIYSNNISNYDVNYNEPESTKAILELPVYHWTIWSIFALAVISLLGGYILSCFLRISPKICLYLFMLVTPMVAFCSFEFIGYNFWFISLKYRFINYLILLIINFIFYVIFCNLTFAMTFECLIIYILGLVNYFVELYRGKPVLPWDIGAASTALQIVDSYKFVWDFSMLYGLLLIGIELFLVAKLHLHEEKKSRLRISILIVPLITLLVIGTVTSKTFTNLLCNYWDYDIIYGYRTQGAFASFCKYAANNQIKKPRGYDPEKLDKINDYIPSSIYSEEVIQPQNIIMIMNESFTNYDDLNDTEYNKVLPYFESLYDTSTYGNLYVSVRGGSTCNTEFEALTGTSLTFFPPGAYPFQSYIHENVASIAQELKEQNYSTVAMHLEQGGNWNRNKVYPRLGFDTFYDINDFDNIESVRQRATDEYNYKKVIDLYENKQSDKFFLFNVTIQNHGGYNGFQDLPQSVHLSEYGEVENAEVYLSMLSMSDKALEALIQYFDKVNEPTMIVVFGDHQPKVDEASESLLLGSASSDEFNKYIVPFLIWKNYEKEAHYIEKMSANYLPSLILKEANLPMSPYYQFMLELFEKYPVISLSGIIDEEGKRYKEISEINSDEMINLYEMWEYKNTFKFK